MCWALNHQNILEMAQGHISLSSTRKHRATSSGTGRSGTPPLHEPKAHTFLCDGSSNDMIEGWCLNTDATHHMTDRQEFFTELDSSVRGSVKFGDAPA
jgi:hypothetical protein